MNTNYLKTLLSIQRTGSFADAAGIMNLSHSTVSIQMKRLEERLDRDLFYKGRRPAKLTPFGVQFCELAKPVVRDFDRLMKNAPKDSTEGPIRMGFVSTMLQTLLPVVLDVFSHKFPKLQVSAVSGLSDEIAQMVESGKLDFGIVSASSNLSKHVRAISYAQEPLRIIAPKGSDIRGNLQKIFSDWPFICFARKTWLGEQIHDCLRECGIEVNQTLELDSIDAIENLVAQGVGVSVVPQRIFAADLEVRLEAIDLPVDKNHRELSLILSPENERISILNALKEIGASAGDWNPSLG